MAFYSYLPYREAFLARTDFARKKFHCETWYKQLICAGLRKDLGSTGMITANQLLSEYLWESTRKPYYCVHPKLVSQLCRVDFAKIPARAVVVPPPFQAISIRLAEENPLLSIEPGKYFLRSMLVHKRVGGDSVSVGGYSMTLRDSVISFWLDFGETKQDFPIYTFKVFPYDNEGTIEDVFHTLPVDASSTTGLPIPDDVVRNCVRMFLSIGFLSQGPFPIDFDVLAADRDKYQTASPAVRQKLEERARKRGKLGWIVGNDAMFEAAPGAVQEPAEGVRGELKHAHIRGGHFHLYWCGPRDTPHLELRWLAPTTVRPDLPFKPE